MLRLGIHQSRFMCGYLILLMHAITIYHQVATPDFQLSKVINHKNVFWMASNKFNNTILAIGRRIRSAVISNNHVIMRREQY